MLLGRGRREREVINEKGQFDKRERDIISSFFKMGFVSFFYIIIFLRLMIIVGQ